MKIEAISNHIGTDQNWQDETTIYWFMVASNDYRIDPGTYGIADCNGELTPLDDDGMPIDYNETLANAVMEVCDIKGLEE